MVALNLESEHKTVVNLEARRAFTLAVPGVETLEQSDFLGIATANKMADKFESAHIDRLRKGNCTMANGVIFIEMLGELAKIGDHLSNIAERTPEIQKHYVKL